MPDRADHLTHTLLSRAQTLERHLREEGIASEAPAAIERRLALISKLLAIEGGVVDGSVDRTVLRLMPSLRPGHAVPEADRQEFAAALRAKLPLASEGS